MSDLQNIDRNTYEMQVAPAVYNRGQLTREKMIARPNADDGSRVSIEAFLRVHDKADSLDCIADVVVARDITGVDTAPIDASDVETPRYVKSILLTNVDTMKKARIEFSYTADGRYSAEVTLGAARQVSLKNGAKKAAALIEDYLSGRRKTRQLPIVSREAVMASEHEHPYDHLAQRFDLE